MADKLLIGTLFISLTYSGLIPSKNMFKLKLLIGSVNISSANYSIMIAVPLTVLILMRDCGLIGAGFYVRYASLSPPVSWSEDFHFKTFCLQDTTVVLEDPE